LRGRWGFPPVCVPGDVRSVVLVSRGHGWRQLEEDAHMSSVPTTVKFPSEFWSVKRYAVAVVLVLVVGAFGAGYWLSGSEPASAAEVDGPVDVRALAGDTDAVTQRLQNEGLVPVGPRQPCDDNVMGGGGVQP
jgi:hypothetical protein